MQLLEAPRFSVIVPVYNVEKYLGECLESIGTQDFEDYEIVIVDDGSTDGSAAVYGRFAAEADARVRIVKQENKGLLAARRAGIAAARGEYLWHVDGDDRLAPNAMITVSGVIDAYNPDIVMIGLSESPDFVSILPGNMPGEQKLYSGEGMNAVRSEFLSGSIPNLVMKISRKSCVDAARDYSEYGKLQLGEDQLQSLYILDSATSCFCLREPLYFYRPNEGSITSRYRDGQIANYAAVKEAVYRQALAWDEKWPGHDFAKTALVGYLSNGFYDMRKNADAMQFERQFQEFRNTTLYAKAICFSSSLRFEQKAFYSLLSKKSDLLAYWWLLACRVVTPVIRVVAK